MATEKRTLKVIANCYIKYDSEICEAGKEFKIRKSDREAMESRGFITVKTKEPDKEEDESDDEVADNNEAGEDK